LRVVLIVTLAAVSYGADPAQTCADGLQKDYRGTKSTTVGGLTCQAWSSQSPHKHSRTPEKYPDAGLEENFCRNPDGEPKGTWCYTTSSGKRWDYCGVPSCEVESEREVFQLGEKKGVTVSLQGVGVKLATREDLGSFYCGGSCEWVFTTDSAPGTLWNITPFQVPSPLRLFSATQSSTAYSGNAARAIDGNTNGNWGKGSCTHSSGAKNNWWMASLAQDSAVNKVVIYNRVDCCSNRINGAKVYVGDSLCGEIKYEAGKVAYEVQCENAVGGTVKVVQNDNVLTLCEVEVFGADSECYKIEKADGYHAGETMRPGSKAWGEGELAVQTDLAVPAESKCWEFVPAEGENTFKIRKRFGSQNGEFLRAPPVNFKDDDVPKTRRFVRVSNDDSFNVWQISSA